jgi:protease-4
VDAVLLDMDSGGGLVSALDDVLEGVEAVRAAGKPIATHVDGTAASAAYMTAAATDLVVADASSGVGSIGVYRGPYYSWSPSSIDAGSVNGTDVERRMFGAPADKSGGHDGVGLSAGEQSAYQADVDALYATVTARLQAARGLDPAWLRDTLGASQVVATNAVTDGLVDAVGTTGDTLAALAQVAGTNGAEVRTLVPAYGGPATATGSAGSAAGAPSGSAASLCDGSQALAVADPIRLCSTVARSGS